MAGTTGGKTSNSGGKTSQDQQKPTSVNKTASKSSLHHASTQGNVNPIISTSPTPSNRSNVGSVASTAPSSPQLQQNKLALNLTSRSSMSNLHGPTGMSSPVGGSPHISAIAMHIPRQIPTLALSRALQLQAIEDGNTQDPTQDHVIETDPFSDPMERSPFQQSRRTSQPTLFADISMLEMANINYNNQNSTRGIPTAKNH